MTSSDDPSTATPTTAVSGVADGWDDPEYQQGVVDLLGVLAYGELSAFERLSDDAAMAPTLTDKASVAAMAVAEFGHFRHLRDRLLELGVDPETAMTPFVAALDAFHESTSPADWLEGLVKAYVGDGFAADFYREIAVHLDPSTRDLVLGVFSDTGHSAFAVEQVRAAIRADPRVAGRLALWGRRLVGEALIQAQYVAAEHDALAGLLIGGPGRPGVDLAQIAEVFNKLTTEHSRRMASLGLAS